MDEPSDRLDDLSADPAPPSAAIVQPPTFPSRVPEQPKPLTRVRTSQQSHQQLHCLRTVVVDERPMGLVILVVRSVGRTAPLEAAVVFIARDGPDAGTPGLHQLFGLPRSTGQPRSRFMAGQRLPVLSPVTMGECLFAQHGHLLMFVHDIAPAAVSDGSAESLSGTEWLDPAGNRFDQLVFLAGKKEIGALDLDLSVARIACGLRGLGLECIGLQDPRQIVTDGQVQHGRLDLLERLHQVQLRVFEHNTAARSVDSGSWTQVTGRGRTPPSAPTGLWTQPAKPGGTTPRPKCSGARRGRVSRRGSRPLWTG